MPLYMDFHKNVVATFDEVVLAHLADLEVQEKHHVKYHKFWINPKEGTIYCLIEAPDRHACEAVHKESHGHLACSIVEVDPDFFKLVMGDGHQVDNGPMHHADGSLDLGYRNILAVSLWHEQGAHPTEARKLALEKITAFHGRVIKWAANDHLIGVFNDPVNAVRCAKKIKLELLVRQSEATAQANSPIHFKIGLSAGQPVTETSELFEEAVQLALRLCTVAREEEILVSSLVKQLCLEEELLEDDRADTVKLLSTKEEGFILELLRITESRLADERFTIDTLSRDIGMSRPQLYRKVTALIGRPPNDLLRELRMEKAMSLIKQKAGNISEIALEVGYNNASYFAKCFHEKFGCNPSSYAENHKG
jgi:AraC-like DNA-binding protein